MKEDRIEDMLKRLGDATEGPVDAALGEKIKRQIPQQISHRRAIDTIRIIIDLRVGKLAVAAAIVVTMAVSMVLFGRGGSQDAGLVQELRSVIAADGLGRERLAEGTNEFYRYLLEQGKQVTFYEENSKKVEPDIVLMHWKLADGTYRVIFADYRIQTVSADELVELQAEMLRSGVK